MITREDILDLYPTADTMEKVVGLISCAAKQGRSSVRMKAPRQIAIEIYTILKFNQRDFDDLPQGFKIFTVYWNY